eukprot:TRINITY_DN16119_c0_g1_i1.p1 TRINITY_DN16119_c0_g1~~TRINITY_DN16119_c0_g1_i1.p1  ORF type:complete len:174 (+),score=52.46 TRINITY_DN16119_c0_g1_i1:179-700(+)
MSFVVVVMGTAGSGKTSTGELLARAIGCPYKDADTFHSQANIDKMTAGIGLVDEDRWPWLNAIHDEIVAVLRDGRCAVLSCSALKKIYRDVLRKDVPGRLIFLFLNGSKAVIAQRLAQRQNHFMKPGMLDSQFAALEAPGAGEPDVITVDVDSSSSKDIVEFLLPLLPKPDNA